MSRPFFTRSERRALFRFIEKFSGIALFALSLALLFALLSYDPRDPGAYSATWEGPSNWLGWPGAFIADILIRTLGVASYAVGLYCLLLSTWLISGGRGWINSVGALRIFGLPFAAIAIATFASSHAAAAPAGGGLGGIIGDFLFGVIAVGLPVYTEQLRLIVATLMSGAAALALTLYALGGTYAGVCARLRYARDEALCSFLELGDMTMDLIHGRRGFAAVAPALSVAQIGPIWRSFWTSDDLSNARRDTRSSLGEPAPMRDFSALRRAIAPRTHRVETRREPPLAAAPSAPRDDDEIRPFDHTPAEPIYDDDPVAEALAAARQAIVRGEPLAPIPRKTPQPERIAAEADNDPMRRENEAAPVATPAAAPAIVEEPTPETPAATLSPADAAPTAAAPATAQEAAVREPAAQETAVTETISKDTATQKPADAPSAESVSEDDDWDEAARAAIESPGAVILNARARLNSDVETTPLSAPVQAARAAVEHAEPTPTTSVAPTAEKTVDEPIAEPVEPTLTPAVSSYEAPSFEPQEPGSTQEPQEPADAIDTHVAETEAVDVDVKEPPCEEPPLSATAPVQAPAPTDARPTPETALAHEPEHAPEPEPEPVPYVLPAIDLLAEPRAEDQIRMTEEMLARRIDQLQGVLHDYGVRGNIIDAHPGPVVTLFELEPARGTKASRVIGLADDIARSMSAVSARVSTVPGRNIIGIELPNQRRETVLLRELLSHPAYIASDGALPLALGKNIAGGPVVANLARMPHLLIAGTTGSGKSVGINTMLMSLLYRLSPQEVKLLLIDPKMLELSVYNDIPHLIAPVVTDPKKAVLALKWAVREMEARYEKMARLNVRGLESYNEKVAEARARGENFERVVQVGFDEATGEPIYETQTFEPEPMPMIVIVVDEMADLMMVAGKEIEQCIQRLAQMARASGIHLIMATQRPSVDVITGTIKANFPIRISFQVTSKIDSRTILGEMGAEQLLGRGDMLYNTGGARLARVHGAFVSDGEVAAVTDHLRSLGSAEYRVDFDQIEGDAGVDDAATTGSGGDDALYDRAVAIVAQERKASTSFIQRRLQIGYNRAARIVEMMEQQGVVSAANHVGKREVLIGQT